MKPTRTLSAALLAAALLAAPASAATETFTIDNVHSVAGFQVRHFFSNVPGRFGEMNGTIQYDAKNLANSSVEVTIPVASVNTQNEKRDGHLKSEDFFHAEKHPHMTFKSTKVVPGKAKDEFQLQGDLTIRGVTKPVTFDVKQLGVGSVGQMGTRGGWEATTTINRKDYGIVWNRTLDQGGAMLGDDVRINLAIAAVKEEPKKDAAPASSK